MALVYISEYSSLAQGGAQQAASAPALVVQPPVAIGAGSVQSAAFSAATRYVRLNTDSACNFAFGANPTAQANVSERLAANSTEYFGVSAGAKVAIIAAAI
jgi:hypothetical protein